MNRTIIAFGLLAGLVAFDQPAHAVDFGLGLFKRRQPKPDPDARVKMLTATLISDLDEAKRLAAADELRGFDPRTHPDIITALVNAFQKDPAVAVRIHAAETLGRLKPVNQSAGLALEAAFAADPDPRVRDAVRSALWQYHLNGYRTTSGTPLTSQTPEPPLASRPATITTSLKPAVTPNETVVRFRPISTSVGKALAMPETAEPPLARPRAAAPPAPPAPQPPAAPPAALPQVLAPPAAAPEPMIGLPIPVIPVAPPATPTPISAPPQPGKKRF